jgi:hypothetical protein
LHTLFHHLEWDWRASSALLSVLASCGTSWAIWAGGDLVTFDVCWHLDNPVIGGSSSGGRWLSSAPIIVIVRGSCAFPGEVPKVTLVDCSWHVWSSSCVGCVAPDYGFGVWCQLAHEPPSEWIATTRTSLLASKWTSVKKILCHLIPRISWYSLWLIVIILWLALSSTWWYKLHISYVAFTFLVLLPSLV